MTFGSLFAGIGGIDLGLERAGMECRWQVEIDPFCRKVLEKHWPDVRRYEDVRTVGADTLESVDLIAGGFPCQDVSVAGKRAGIAEGTRSGLWSEFHRLICELRPRYVFIENVLGLLSAPGRPLGDEPDDDIRAIGTVLGDLARIGYDAEWEVLSAADVGAPHLRKRVWIVAHADDEGLQRRNGEVLRERADQQSLGAGSPQVAYATGTRWRPTGCSSETLHESQSKQRPSRCNRTFGGQWQSEPDVGRVAHGVPSRVDRLKSLGNAVVPQCAEVIGRRIMAYDS